MAERWDSYLHIRPSDSHHISFNNVSIDAVHKMLKLYAADLRARNAQSGSDWPEFPDEDVSP